MNNSKLIRASDVMQDDFAMIDGLKTVAEALDALISKNATTLVIEKRSDADEFGILLLSDISKKVLAKDKAPERVNVYEIMSKPVISIKPDMDVRYCARLFDRFGLTLAPVIDNNKVLGIVDYRALVLKGLVKIYD